MKGSPTYRVYPKNSTSSRLLPAVFKTLSQIPDNSTVVIDASRSINIDQDVIEIIEDFKANAKYRSIEVQSISRKNPVLSDQVKQFEVAVLNGTHSNRKEDTLLTDA